MTSVAPTARSLSVPSSPIAVGAFLLFTALTLMIPSALTAQESEASVGPHLFDRVPELRVATTYGNSAGAAIITAAWYLPALRLTRANRFELAAGIIDDGDKANPFLFAGPVWARSNASERVFVEFSIGPAILSRSRVEGREIGGTLHFRSALAIGAAFGDHRDTRIALRIAHISNGGLQRTNPGLDFAGASFTIRIP